MENTGFAGRLRPGCSRVGKPVRWNLAIKSIRSAKPPKYFTIDLYNFVSWSRYRPWIEDADQLVAQRYYALSRSAWERISNVVAIDTFSSFPSFFQLWQTDHSFPKQRTIYPYEKKFRVSFFIIYVVRRKNRVVNSFQMTRIIPLVIPNPSNLIPPVEKKRNEGANSCKLYKLINRRCLRVYYHLMV